MWIYKDKRRKYISNCIRAISCVYINNMKYFTIKCKRRKCFGLSPWNEHYHFFLLFIWSSVRQSCILIRGCYLLHIDIFRRPDLLGIRKRKASNADHGIYREIFYFEVIHTMHSISLFREQICNEWITKWSAFHHKLLLFYGRVFFVCLTPQKVQIHAGKE